MSNRELPSIRKSHCVRAFLCVCVQLSLRLKDFCACLQRDSEGDRGHFQAARRGCWKGHGGGHEDQGHQQRLIRREEKGLCFWFVHTSLALFMSPLSLLNAADSKRRERCRGPGKDQQVARCGAHLFVLIFSQKPKIFVNFPLSIPSESQKFQQSQQGG